MQNLSGDRLIGKLKDVIEKEEKKKVITPDKPITDFVDKAPEILNYMCMREKKKKRAGTPGN